MKWYADHGPLRIRQQLLDAGVLVGVLLLARLGQLVYAAVQRLQAAGVQLEQAGGGLAHGLGDAARRVGGAPLVGDRLRGPLDAAGSAARTVAAAGIAQQHAVHRVAVLLGLAVALLPIGYLLSRWLPYRLGYAREAGAAVALRADTDLLALRAATSAPLHRLARLGPEPVGRWRRGEPGAAQALAALELSRLGVSPAARRGTEPELVDSR